MWLGSFWLQQITPHFCRPNFLHDFLLCILSFSVCLFNQIPLPQITSPRNTALRPLFICISWVPGSPPVIRLVCLVVNRLRRCTNNRQISSKAYANESETIAISYQIPWALWWNRCISAQPCSYEGSLVTKLPPPSPRIGLHRVLQRQPAKNGKLWRWWCWWQELIL